MRASGILLPVASLPSRYGIGCFSKEAYEFVDRLEEAGQSYWQILPLGPTGYGDSPYQSFSTFAGNPYFIDLETLVKEGLLTEEECDACDFGDNAEYIDYERFICPVSKYSEKHLKDLRQMTYMMHLYRKMVTGWRIMRCIWRLRMHSAESAGVSGRQN